MDVPERVRAAVEAAVAGTGLHPDGVEVVRAGARSVVRVTVDLPDDAVGSVGSDQLAAASRAVSAALDGVDDALGSAPYVLEVGSPGVGRPLVERRHWARARTRLVQVALAGEQTTGRVLAVDDGGVVLDVDGHQRRAAWADLGTGRVQVEMSRPRAPEDPADGLGDGLDGADDDEDGEG